MTSYDAKCCGLASTGSRELDAALTLMRRVLNSMPSLTAAWALAVPRTDSLTYLLQTETGDAATLPNDQITPYAFAFLTGQARFEDGIQLGGCELTRNLVMPVRVAVVATGHAVDLGGVFSGVGSSLHDGQIRITGYQPDTTIAFVELFGIQPVNQAATWADFDVTLFDFSDLCTPFVPVCGGGSGGTSPIPCPTPPAGGLTCETIAACQVIIDIIAQFGPINSELQSLSNAISALNGRVDITEQDIQALALGLAAADGNITALQGDVATINGQISTLQTDVSTAQSTADQAALDAAAAQLTANSAQATADIGARWRDQMLMPLEGIGVTSRLVWSLTGNPTTLTLAANNYTFQSFICDLISQPTTLYLYIQTPQAGATAQFTLYDDTNTYALCPAPGNPLWSSAVFSCAVSTLVAIPLTGLPALVPGTRYFCGLICDNAAVGFRSYANAQMQIIGNTLATRSWRTTDAGQSPGGTAPTNPSITPTSSSNTLFYVVQ